MFKPKRKSLVVNGLKFFYFDTESPGPTIFCLHGRIGRAETWWDLMSQYSDRYRIIAPDQRGHGLSDKPAGYYRSEEMANDAAAIINGTTSGPVVVIGHSMGGRVAAYLTAMHKEAVRALVVLDQTAAGPVAASPLPLDQLPTKDSFTANWPLPFASYTEAQSFLLETTGSTIRTNYYLNSLIEREDGFHMLFSQQATAAIFEYQQDWFHLLPEIAQPTLLVRAKDSKDLPFADLVRMKNVLTRAQSVEVTNPDHHVYLSDPQEFYRLLDTFLQEIKN